MLFWVSPAAGWRVSQRLVTFSNPPEAVSSEPREVEFEVRGPEQRRTPRVTIPAYALYYVCEGVNGICMYRRQDVPIIIAPRE